MGRASNMTWLTMIGLVSLAALCFALLARVFFKRGPVPMSLATENGTKLDEVREGDVMDALRALEPENNSFAILERGDEEYIQTALHADGSWSLEYRAGSADRHFAAIDRDLDGERVASAFRRYLAGADIRTGFSWHPLDLGAPLDQSPLTPAEQARARMLADLYGLEFPPSLFQFHTFITGSGQALWEEARSPLGLAAAGPLQVLLRFDSATGVKPAADMLLHWRYYRDPPEFFTFMTGDMDGLHWGLLLDDPAEGFRGAASYYNNDGDLIQVYGGLFDALFDHAGDILSTLEEWIAEDTTSKDDYRANTAKIRAFTRALRGYVTERDIATKESRSSGVTSETGLSVVLPGGDRTLPIRARGIDGSQVAELVKECNKGRPGKALLAGRELWHFGGDTTSDDAYQLLHAAYVALDRKQLVRVLDTHYRDRDRKNVDLLPR